ncbi:MAG TPA: hypothetical protein VN860_06105 [Candidatus Acidoferrales bacterium]|nr:hypothetical protein [Candidatus Acidoferrales bacterium]
MTIRASSAPEVPALEPASHAPSTPPAMHASFGVVVGGTLSGDVIVLSHRALAIVRAERLVRAFVIAGLETLRRTVALSMDRTLRLEYGIYQLV